LTVEGYIITTPLPLDVGKEVFTRQRFLDHDLLVVRYRGNAEHLAWRQYSGSAYESELEKKIAAGEGHGTKIGEWRMANGEWRVASGEWRVENGEGS
jgi:hypothetical protein